MDLSLALKLYVTKMIDDSKDGMKLLLMDKTTTSIISMIFTQTEMLQKEVFLFEHIDTEHREAMRHMKAICFIQPTPDNIVHLENELRSPKYDSYYIYFSNSISDSSIQLLAQADESELVHEIKEFYMEYLVLSPHLYSMNCPNSSQPSRVWEPDCFTASRAGLISVLLSLKKSPAIRFQAGSEQCERLARDVASVMKRDESFRFRQKEALPLLLILDRRDDPVTPLLNQWTYQAMVHEILDITKNRVDLSKFADIPKDLHEIVMSSDQDEFYRENMYCNYGEIGLNIKQLVDQYQTKFKSQAKVETIAEMKTFVENYPQFRKLSGTVSKHVAVMGELSKMVKQCNLMEISELEQEICANSDHSKHLALVKQMLSRTSTCETDGLRLALLYALKYERNSSKELQPIVELLTHNSQSPDKARRLVSAITEYGGFDRRSSDLFGTASPLSFTKKLLKGLKDVENIFTQHTPLLTTTLEAVLKGKLKESQFPVATPQSVERPQDIIVFMVGGVTYEEALAVANLNKSNQGAVRIVLGGTHVHNCKSFLNEVLQSTYAGGGAKKGAMKRDIP